MKTCTKCGVEKPLEGFHRRAASKDGFQPRCRGCRNESRKKRNDAKPESVARRSARATAQSLLARGEKVCGTCSVTKSIEEYCKQAKAWDGLQRSCRECTNMARSEWQKDNTGRANANTAAYRAAKLQRTPPWADLKAIEQVYIDRPEGRQVDHVIPLQGKNVSGLHVLDNLQYLTGPENSSKGNSY